MCPSKKEPWRRTRAKWENFGEAIRFARGGAQCFPWITKEWPALPLRSVPSSQSLAPAVWLSPHRNCHVLSALLRAAFSVSAFLAFEFAPIARAKCLIIIGLLGGERRAWAWDGHPPPLMDRPYPYLS